VKTFKVSVEVILRGTPLRQRRLGIPLCIIFHNVTLSEGTTPPPPHQSESGTNDAFSLVETGRNQPTREAFCGTKNPQRSLCETCFSKHPFCLRAYRPCGCISIMKMSRKGSLPSVLSSAPQCMQPLST
jgi:hypothetical protein